MEIIEWLLGEDSFPARGHCGNWSDVLGLTHIISDWIIFLCYMVMPLLALTLVRKLGASSQPLMLVGTRQTEIASKWFVAFVLVCGLGHGLEPIIFWVPIYRIQAALKFLTAVVSVGSCSSFWALRVSWN